MDFERVAFHAARSAVSDRARGRQRDAAARRQQARHVLARREVHLDAARIDCILPRCGIARAVHISRRHDGLDRPVRPQRREISSALERDRPLRVRIVQLRMAAGDKRLA